VFVWWLWCLCAWPSCPPASTTDLEDVGLVLEEAYDALDVAGFDAHASNLRELVSCWDRPLSEKEAVAVHRWWGLVANTKDEASTMRRAWAAARQLDPDWTLAAQRWPVGHPVYQAFAEAGAVASDRVSLAPNHWRVDGRPSTTVPRDRAFVLQQLVDGVVVYTGYHQSLDSVPAERNVPSGLRGQTVGLWFGGSAGSMWRDQRPSGDSTPFGARSLQDVGVGSAVGASVLWSPKVGSDVDILVVRTGGLEAATHVWPTVRARAHLVGRAGAGALEVVGSLGVGYARVRIWDWGGTSDPFASDMLLLLPGLEMRRVWERWRVRGRVEGLLASAWRPSGVSGRLGFSSLLTERFSLRLDAFGRVHQVEALALNASGQAERWNAYAEISLGGGWSW